MRALDIALPVALAVVAAGALRTARRRRRLHMPVAGRIGSGAGGALVGLLVLASAAVLQSTDSGWRWQLAPAVLTALPLGVILLMRSVGRTAVLARTIASVAILGALLSLALSWALPVRILPLPDGPHAVGTTTIVVRDDQRIERYGPAPGGAREIVVQFWYPASADTVAEPTPLIPQPAALTGLGAAELGLPRFALGHLRRIPSNSTRDAEAIDGPLPVALLAHGWTGLRTLHTDLAEQLASNGWVVVAADHRYGALVTTFPDGRADLFDEAALPEFGTVPDEVYAHRSRQLIATFADDLLTMVGTLEHDPPAVLEGRLQLDRIGFLGHSTGGGAAIAACAVEPRCAAVIGFDPWVEPVDRAVQRQGIDAPLLSLRTQDWVERPNEVALQALHGVQREAGRSEGIVGLDGALHGDFTLLGALSPLARILGLTGETPGVETRAVTMTWTTEFLRHHVQDAGPDPLTRSPHGHGGRLESTP